MSAEQTGRCGCCAAPCRRTRRRIVLVIQHAAFAGPGLLDIAARTAGVQLHVVHSYRSSAVPGNATGYDGVVVLGGPQAAYDDADFPTRKAELALIEHAVSTGIPTLGICLGAQLLALVAGGAVWRGTTPEIGVHEVQMTVAAATDPLTRHLPRRLPVMQSHFDGITLPSAATLLATGSGQYPVQLFAVGSAAWGAQFHPEADDGFAAKRRLAVPGWHAAETGAGLGSDRYSAHPANVALLEAFLAQTDPAARRPSSPL